MVFQVLRGEKASLWMSERIGSFIDDLRRLAAAA
jgi:hypothetical protein